MTKQMVTQNKPRARSKDGFQACGKTTFLAISKIHPSPENDLVYGAIETKDIDLVNLANDIVGNGIREPLVISADGYIVSGHRRYAAAKLVGIEIVPVRKLDILRSGHTSIEWQKVLRAYNHQRVKPASVRMKEAMLDIDPDIAYKQLITQREELDRNAPPQMIITGTKVRSEISDRKQPMLDAAILVITCLKSYWPVTVRHVHYGLLNNPPMRNTSTGVQGSIYTNDKD
jgi:hypothetical protein